MKNSRSSAAVSESVVRQGFGSSRSESQRLQMKPAALRMQIHALKSKRMVFLSNGTDSVVPTPSLFLCPYFVYQSRNDGLYLQLQCAAKEESGWGRLLEDGASHTTQLVTERREEVKWEQIMGITSAWQLLPWCLLRALARETQDVQTALAQWVIAAGPACCCEHPKIVRFPRSSWFKTTVFHSLL